MNATKADQTAGLLDEKRVFIEASDRFLKSLNSIDKDVKELIASNQPLWDELKRLQAQAQTGGAGNLLGKIKIAQQAAVATLDPAMLDLAKAAEDFLHYVYELASRRKNPAIFLGLSSNSLASAGTLGDGNTPEGRKARRGKQQKALDEIDQVAISSGDTIKEINRLLDHTSTKRMAEEMDIVTYQSNAKRQFDRIQAEFNQALGSFVEDQGEVRTMSNAVADFRLKERGWAAMLPRVTDEKGSVRPVLETPDVFDSASAMMTTADTFLRRYGNFLDYAKSYAGSVGREFYTEASVEAYKDGTRVHAERIAREGLFASRWTILMGLASGLAVASILILYDNNLVLKNWIVPAACAASVIAYLFSVSFGQTARDRIMNDLRRTLYDSVSDSPVVVSPKAPKATATGKVWVWVKTWSFDKWLGARALAAYHILMRYLDFGSGGSEEYFKFNKIKWSKLDDVVTNSDQTKDSLALKIYKVNKIKWPMNQSRAFLRNAVLLLLILAIPLIFSHYSRTFGRDKQFAFISRTDELGSCVLERGRVLLASGGSYFVETRDGNPVTEIAKSLVLRIEPIDQRQQDGATTKQGEATAAMASEPNLPSCDKPRPEPKTPDQTALVTATDKLAGSVKDGLESVAGKLGAGTGQIDPVSLVGLVTATDKLTGTVKDGLQAVADRISVLPVNPGSGASAAPIIIQMPPAAVQEAQAGPTLLTLIYTTDGKVYDAGNGRIILPFVDPVTGGNDKAFWGENGIDTVEKAFYFGANSLSDPKLPGTGALRKILREYAASYVSCMKRAKAAGAPRLKLSVEGYASENWQAARTDEERRNLNLFLAEGRRIAVINALDVDPSLIEIDNRPEPDAFGNWAQVKADKVRNNFLFKTYDAMSAGLLKRLPQLSKDDKPMRVENLAHTAFISIDGEQPEQCPLKAG